MLTINQMRNQFYSRWNLPHVKIEEEEELNNVKLRICKLLSKMNGGEVSLDVDGSTRHFEFNLVIDETNLCVYFPHESHSPFTSSANTLQRIVLATKTLYELLFNIKLLFNQITTYTIDYPNNYKMPWKSNIKVINHYVADKFQETFKKIIELSSINVSVIFNKIGEQEYDIDFFPRGDSILDQALVNDVLPLLAQNSKKQFLEALNYYQLKKYEAAADHLRKTLESWLKESLNTNKTLDGITKNLTGEIQKVLNEKINAKFGKNKDKAILQTNYISNFIGDTFPSLTNLFSRYEIAHNDSGVKHATPEVIQLQEAEIEFMLYQTGAIIRFLDKILNVEK